MLDSTASRFRFRHTSEYSSQTAALSIGYSTTLPGCRKGDANGVENSNPSRCGILQLVPRDGQRGRTHRRQSGRSGSDETATVGVAALGPQTPGSRVSQGAAAGSSVARDHNRRLRRRSKRQRQRGRIQARNWACGSCRARCPRLSASRLPADGLREAVERVYSDYEILSIVETAGGGPTQPVYVRLSRERRRIVAAVRSVYRRRHGRHLPACHAGHGMVRRPARQPACRADRADDKRDRRPARTRHRAVGRRSVVAGTEPLARQHDRASIAKGAAADMATAQRARILGVRDAAGLGADGRLLCVPFVFRVAHGLARHGHLGLRAPR